MRRDHFNVSWLEIQKALQQIQRGIAVGFGLAQDVADPCVEFVQRLRLVAENPAPHAPAAELALVNVLVQQNFYVPVARIVGKHLKQVVHGFARSFKHL